VKLRARLLPAILVLAGLAVITGLVIYFGAGDVLKALTSVSIYGFAAYIAAQLVITLGLALCWRMLLRSRMRGSFPLLVWGRLVRDATGEFLPFSQVGGYVLGARVITLGGVSPADATASTFADITTEFLGQLVFIGIGLALLAYSAPDNRLLLPVGIGLAIAVIMAVGLVLVQRGKTGLLRRIAGRIGGRAGKTALEQLDRLQASLDQVYGNPGRLAWAAFLHLVCWFGTATASYIGFHALGLPVTYATAFMVEALLHAIMALAFFIPGRVGVQEAAYAVLAGLFGIPPDIALSLSLLRRARDFVIAVPVLLAWQGVEARNLRGAA
jgi:putative membrane protein